MALANYCLRGDLMDEMQISDPNEESRVDRAIVDASRAVDAFCGRDPGTFAAQTLAKVFDVQPTRYRSRLGSESSSWANDWVEHEALAAAGVMWNGNQQELRIPPLLSVTTFKTDEDGDGVYEVTWTASTDYLLWPRNDEVKRRVDVNTVAGAHILPAGLARVQIAGSWGFTEGGLTPYGIRRATLLLAMNYYRRPSSQLNSNGLGGAAIHFGYIDPDVASLLWSVAGKYREGMSFTHSPVW
jgi:hypothetical protein